MTTKTRGIDFSELTLKDALDLAVLVEQEAEERYLELAHQMETHRTEEAGAFFRWMAGNEHKHGADLAARRAELFAGSPRRVTRSMLFDIEAPDYDEARAFMSQREALQVAMRSEQKAYAFFDAVLQTTPAGEVRALFEELRREEIHHQDLVSKEIAKLPEGEPLPNDTFADDPIPL